MERLTFAKIETGYYTALNEAKNRKYVVVKVGPKKWQTRQHDVKHIHFDSDNTDLYLTDPYIVKQAWSATKWEAVADAHIMEARELGDRDAANRFHLEVLDRIIGEGNEDIKAEFRTHYPTNS